MKKLLKRRAKTIQAKPAKTRPVPARAAVLRDKAKANAQRSVKIGDFVRDVLIAREYLDDGAVPTTAIVDATKRVFPKSKVNPFHVYWYAKQLRQLGQLNS